MCSVSIMLTRVGGRGAGQQRKKERIKDKQRGGRARDIEREKKDGDETRVRAGCSEM